MSSFPGTCSRSWSWQMYVHSPNIFVTELSPQRRSRVHCRCAPILRNDYQFPSGYAAIVSLEHLLFKKNDPENYNAEIWDIPAKLPTGIAALAAGIGSFGLVIPCMHQPWFLGPIARSTRDIGFEVVSAMLYAPFRWLEIRWKGII